MPRRLSHTRHRAVRPPGQPRRYGPERLAVLEPLWAASDHLCGKPLGPDDPCELMGCAWPQGRQVRAANDGAASQWGVWQGGYGSLGRVFVVLGPSDREVGR